MSRKQFLDAFMAVAFVWETIWEALFLVIGAVLYLLCYPLVALVLTVIFYAKQLIARAQSGCVESNDIAYNEL